MSQLLSNVFCVGLQIYRKIGRKLKMWNRLNDIGFGRNQANEDRF